MIQFGLSEIKAYTNGLGSGCAITTGNAGATAVVASGYCYIGGITVTVSANDVDISALSPASGVKYIFGRIAAGQSSTATLDATSIDPRRYNGAVLGLITQASGSCASLDTSGVSGIKVIGRAMNCSLNITYDQAIARGGTMIFGNDSKLYNGVIEGTLEHAEFTGQDWAYMYGGAFASGGAGCGTWTLSGSDEPFPFMIQTQQITNGVTSTVHILKCYSPGLTMSFDRENYTQPSMNFQAIGNQCGTVIKIDTT